MKLSSILLQLLARLGLMRSFIVDGDGGGSADDEQGEGDDQQGGDADDGAGAAGDGDDAGDADQGDVAGADEEGDDDGDVSIGFGDEPQVDDDAAKGGDSSVIRGMRKEHRELTRALRDKEKRIAELEAKVAPAPVVLGPEPQLEDPDVDYDPAKYKEKLKSWMDRKAAVDAEQRRKDEEQERANAEWQAEVDGYKKAKASLKVADVEEAEEIVFGALSVTQRGILITGLKNHAQLVYALSKSPEKLKELAAITNPVKFAVAASKLEDQVKVSNKKVPPPPDRRVGGNVSGTAAIDGELAKLEKEADRTGDRTKVAAYHRRLREQKRASA